MAIQKQYKNVVVMLFDGMGSDALAHHLPDDSFLQRHHTGMTKEEMDIPFIVVET